MYGIACPVAAVAATAATSITTVVVALPFVFVNKHNKS